MKSFIESQFGYCPLVWMMHSRTLNSRINRIHKRALRFVYDDQICTFKDLLCLDRSFTVHERNIQSLAIEIFKVIHKLSPEIMGEIFVMKTKQIYSSEKIFITRNVRTVHKGLEALSFLDPKIWAIIPNDIRDLKDLSSFKRQIRKWKPDGCPCRICKTYIAGVGFANVVS